MNKNILLMALIFLTCIFFSNPIHAYEPTAFIINETNLLSTGESLGEYLEITLDDESYYVVKVLVAEEFVGFIALQKEKEEVIEGEVTVKQLFKTTDFIIQYSEFKKEVKENPYADWFITKGKIAKNLADSLKNEENDLVIVDNQLNDPTASEMISELKTLLATLATKTLLLAESMNNANNLEISFLSKPYVDGELELNLSLQEVFSSATELDADFIEYQSKTDSLKKYIGQLDLPIESKKSLNNVLDLPENFGLISSWAYNASDFENSIDAVYNKASSNAIDLTNAFKIRLEMAETYSVLYGENSQIKKEFGSKYESIEKAVSFILSPENFYKWQRQDLVSKMQKDWQDAEKFFKKNQFDKAKNSANKAKSNALSLHKAGFIAEEPTEQPLINYELLFTGVLAIIILLIVLILIRRRKKLAEFLKKEEEEGVDVYKWK